MALKPLDLILRDFTNIYFFACMHGVIIALPSECRHDRHTCSLQAIGIL